MKRILTATILVVWPVWSLNAQPHTRLLISSLDWSPDGKKIAFTAAIVKSDFSDMGPGKWVLYEYDTDSEHIETLEKGAVFASYHPGGEKIAFSKLVDENWDIYVRELVTGSIDRLTTDPSKDNAPNWSPDGSRLVFNSERDGNVEVYLMNADGSNIIKVTQTDTAKNYNPQWAPGGERITYFREIGDKMDQIFLTDASGSRFTNLTNNRKHNFYPTWYSADEILYTAGSEGNRLYLLNMEEKSNKPVENLQGFYAKKSPRVPAVAVIKRGEDGNHGIHLFNLETREWQTLIVKEDMNGAMSN